MESLKGMQYNPPSQNVQIWYAGPRDIRDTDRPPHFPNPSESNQTTNERSKRQTRSNLPLAQPTAHRKLVHIPPATPASRTEPTVLMAPRDNLPGSAHLSVRGDGWWAMSKGWWVLSGGWWAEGWWVVGGGLVGGEG